MTRGLQRNAGSSEGLEGLIGALGSGGHERYVDSPDLLGSDETRTQGNAILGHIFGSKDVSRSVAAHASEGTGLDSGLLRKLLPLVASVAMGALSKKTGAGGSLRQSPGDGTDLLGSLLGGLLGGPDDGSQAADGPLDDILGLAKKFL